MKNPFSKIPFLFLLIPLIIGILLQYYFRFENISIVIFLLGVITILFSFMIPKQKEFALRWVFGLGTFISIIGIGSASTWHRQQSVAFSFQDEVGIYRGIVEDIPQEKKRSIAYEVYLPDEDKRIVCYFQKDSLQNEILNPGEKFIFQGKIQSFRNFGNPDDFDYVRYMHNQGFSGSSFIQIGQWQGIGSVETSLKFSALKIRQQLLDFYKSLNFDDTEYSILAALTLGYQGALSDDLLQGFRTTGTVHVLSVSGLHVGIIYLMISFLLSFIRRGDKYYFLKPLLIILLLWLYAFVTGLPVSVVRASLMLTIFCVSEIIGKKSFSIHALFIAAFFILLYSPLSLFDVSFQLSFMSVLAILCLHPEATNLVVIKNKYLRNVWSMFTLSVVAQLATFPICLYYFGTFPTYFFLANLVIVPLVSLITYAMLGVALSALIANILPQLEYYIYYLPVHLLEFLVHLMTKFIQLFEKLPFALIEDVQISLLDVFVIFTIIITFLIFLIYKKPESLIVSLIAICLPLSIHLYENFKMQPDHLTVYNRPYSTDIRWVENEIETAFNMEVLNDGFEFMELRGNKILIVSKNVWEGKISDKLFFVDNLILTEDNNLSLYSITKLLEVKNVVLDGSLTAYARRRLSKECQNLNIPCHDVVENGAFTLNF